MKSRGQNSRVTVALFISVLAGLECAALTGGGGQVRVSPPAAPARLLSGLKSKDPSARREAANELGALRARDATQALIVTLLDKDARVREAAAFALGQLTDRRAIEPLLGVLRDKDAEVRASALFALGMIGDRKAVLAVSNALGDSSRAVRSSAAVALGLMQDEAGLDEMIDMLDDPAFDVRYDCVWSLGQLGDPDAIDHLIASLVTLDLSHVDDSQRESFRVAVQNSIEGLQPQTLSTRTIGSAARPRRAVESPVEETRPRRTLPYGNAYRE